MRKENIIWLRREQPGHHRKKHSLAMPVLATNAESETGIPKSLSNELPSETMEEIEHTCPQPRLVSKRQRMPLFVTPELFALLGCNGISALWSEQAFKNRLIHFSFVCIVCMEKEDYKALIMLLHDDRQFGIIACFCGWAVSTKEITLCQNGPFLCLLLDSDLQDNSSFVPSLFFAFLLT